LPSPDLIYEVTSLQSFARALLRAVGLEDRKADAVAEILIAGDLMGHSTHGLALLPSYLDEIAAGLVKSVGDVKVLKDRQVTQLWDADAQPGPWAMLRAVESAVERAAQYGLAAIAVRNAHHTASLAAYLQRGTARGYVAMLACSDPASRNVAPFGGRDAVFTPNPFAVGIPTRGEPILIDMSASITTNALSRALFGAGDRFPAAWAIDADGRPSDDPSVLFREPRGALLPTGGMDHGHKGFAFAVMIEALTQGLGGVDRNATFPGRSSSIFVLIMDPDAFGSRDAFVEHMQQCVEACRASRPLPGGPGVRLPGERAMTMWRTHMEHGVPVSGATIDALSRWATKLGVTMPAKSGPARSFLPE
jgi:LDH2 family malate/lactate/ureidoglycolate dehydrogenase